MKAGELLLKIERVGLCGSDLTTFRGLNPMVTYPRIPGHEIAEAVGAAETFLVAVNEAGFTGRVVYIGWAKNPVA